MNDRPSAVDILFEVSTPLNFTVRTTISYWEFIVTIKHPMMRDYLADVERTLSDPDEIRLSKSDRQVYLFYRREVTTRWVCAVAKKLNGEAFLITAYSTRAIKEGVQVWQK